jgi:hypothetical protein
MMAKISATWRNINLPPIDDGPIVVAACLIVEGGDPLNPQHRYALIEKTARIRIRPGSGGRYKLDVFDFLNWATSPHRWSGPLDEEARAWCIAALHLFGHDVGQQR